MVEALVSGAITFIKYAVNVALSIGIIVLFINLLVNFVQAIVGFGSLITPWEGSIMRDLYLMISMWSPINFGILFNHVILISGTTIAILIMYNFFGLWNRSFKAGD